MVSLGVSPTPKKFVSPRGPSPNVQSKFPPSPSFQRSNMPAQARNSVACKKYFELPLSDGEQKHVDICMAMNATK